MEDVDEAISIVASRFVSFSRFHDVLTDAHTDYFRPTPLVIYAFTNSEETKQKSKLMFHKINA